MDQIRLQKEKKLNKLATQNKVLFTVTMIFKVIIVLIYGIGYYIEKAALKVYRIGKKLITVGIFQTICMIGEWVLRTGKAIGKVFVKIITGIAGNFVKNFSWWAPAIGLACIACVLVFSNFFSIALEVTINGNVVGYVKDENEYHEILNKVENQIQSQLTTGTVLSEEEETEQKADSNNKSSNKRSSEESNIMTASAAQDDEAEIASVDEANAENTALNLDSESYALTTTAKYSLSVVRKAELQNEDNLYTDVYFAVSELVGTNYGLYVDGEFKAACADKETIEQVLEQVKEPYETGEKDTRIDFVEDVQIKKGMFAADTLKDAEQLKALFESGSDKTTYYTCEEGDYLSTIAKKFGMTTAQLKALNSNIKDSELTEGKKLNVSAPEIYLRVKTIKTITYTESIAFNVTRKSTDELYKGTTKVKTEGEKGKQTVTAEVTYINGKRVGQETVSTKVTKKPVDKVILVGTKKRSYYSSSGSSSYNFTQGSGVPSGSFINPLPGAYLSCGFMGYSGHTGADLCLRGGTLGASIRAADGGTVEYAGWSGGYGRLIRINHGNGFYTYYAHLSAMFVTPGDKVSAGQYIGKAGSSGNSTGPHLHFEIRYKGTAYNPMRYISL